jgi:dipeptidyl aminopeptidase/acylaminoacyl peptidase
MTNRRHVLPTLILFVALSGLAGAQQLSPFTPEVALDVRSVRIAAVTDDGSRIAATVQTRRDRTDVDHQRYGDPTYISPVSTRMMVIDTRSGTQTWIHEEPARLGDVAWSRDGNRLAYFMVEGDRHTLRIFDARTGTTTTVALQSSQAIASSSPLEWSPDGRTILIGLRPEGWASEARQAFLDLTEAAVIVQDSRDDFLAWDRVRNIADQQVTALVTVADGSVREMLTDVTPQGAAFSEDGAFLTYSTTKRTRTSYTRRDGADYALWMFPLDGEPQALIAPREERINVSWTDARDAFAYSDEGSVFVRRVGEEEEPVDVTASHRKPVERRERGADATEAPDPDDERPKEPRFSVNRWSPSGDKLLLTTERGWHLLDLGTDELSDLLVLEEDEDSRPRRSVQAWSEDGRHLYFTYSARDRWQRGLKRLDVESGEVADVLVDENLYGSWNVSDDGATIVYTSSDGDRPNEIWVTGRNHAAPRALTSSNPQLDEVALTRSELVEYLDVDGNTLYGILYYPRGYQPGQRYPLVAEIYEDFFDNGFNENMNLITAQGWFGFRPSVRFDEGYPGEAWLKAVPTAINKLIERGLVDGDKVGVYGQSYGGYATNLLITQTNRFAAAANVSGKVNMVSFLGDSPRITTRNYAAAESGQDRIGSTLWEQPHKYIEHSAVMFADRIETPLLMLSGEGDWNVPATNQREMYYALRRLGKEVVWVNYTNGGHGAGRASSAKDFVDHWQRMFDWFAEHFEEPEKDSTG